MFNNYGDKIMSNNMDGNFTIYQLNCHSKNMRKLPIFSLYGEIDSRITDFDLLNSDNNSFGSISINDGNINFNLL